MTKIFLGAGLLLAATAAGAQLAPNAPVAPRDGVQTRAEVVERTGAMFARVDTNRDGFITQQERQAVRGGVRARAGERRAERLADGGRGAGRAQLFDRLDQNRDGRVTREERQQSRQQRQTQRPATAVR
jgi:hypothetical protein